MPKSNRSSVALVVILIASGLLGVVFGQRVQTAKDEDADVQQNLRQFTQVVRSMSATVEPSHTRLRRLQLSNPACSAPIP